MMTREDYYYFSSRICGRAEKRKVTHKPITPTSEGQFVSSELEMILESTGSKKVLQNSILLSP